MAHAAIAAIACGLTLMASTPAAGAEPLSPSPAPLDATQAQLPDKAPDPQGLSDSELDSLRGGENLIVTTQTLVAITTGNVINGGYTAGNVSLSDNALSNFNGLGNVLINTGAQVSLQTGMNVTINMGQ